MYPFNYIKNVHPEDESLVFVAMPFSTEYDPIYKKLIQKGVSKASKILSEKLKPYRADDSNFTREGWPNILQKIFSARLIIGVLTDYNQNVYYELGIAHSTRPLTKQILISENGHKQSFDTKDIIQLKFPRFDPGKSADKLCNSIVSTIQQSENEDELSIQIVEATLGPLELELIEKVWIETKSTHFILNQAYLHYYQALTNICRDKIVRLSTLVLENGKLEKSWYWTPLGIRLLRKWNKIDGIKVKKWIINYRKIFGSV